jgi:hypothetical protein
VVFKLSFQVLEAKTSLRRMACDLGNGDLGNGRGPERFERFLGIVTFVRRNDWFSSIDFKPGSESVAQVHGSCFVGSYMTGKVDFSHTLRADLLVLLKMVERFERFFRFFTFMRRKAWFSSLVFRSLKRKRRSGAWLVIWATVIWATEGAQNASSAFWESSLS